MSNLTTSAGLAAGLIAYAVQQGADRTALMARAGLRTTDLEDPDSRLPFATYVALMRAAQDLCKAVRLGSRKAKSMVDSAGVTCP